ncbi:MAG: GNAT family N-acetyltransferase [Candidatus Heimdallarchaeota archaeon]|nr:GNAT family N-acetyltransferase [Candidatus Heimdallarchaeota archaeon]
MENIEFNILNGFEIQSNYIEQYIDINLSENPKFTREIQFPKFKNFLKQEREIKVILATSGDKLLGWLMVSFAENRGLYHFNMVVHREFQRVGIGKQLLIKAKENFDELYGVVVPVNRYKRRDGTQYKTPIEFYKQNGFSLTGKKFVEYRDVQLVEIKWSTK